MTTAAATNARPSALNPAIVAGVDFDPESERALDTAIEMTAGWPGAQLHVLYVDSEPATSLESAKERVDEAIERLHALCAARLHARARSGRALEPGRVVAHYRAGTPAEQIVQLAVDVDADLIVVGTHGRRGLQRLVLGSVAARVLSYARCPVYVTRRKDHEGIGVVPEIEPPCAECVATRKNSAGQEWWCERHAGESRRRPHHYRYVQNEPTSSPAPWGAAFD